MVRLVDGCETGHQGAAGVGTQIAGAPTPADDAAGAIDAAAGVSLP